MNQWLPRWLRAKTEPEPSRAQSITIVSGLPRSGTSLMMKMLDAGGLPLLTDNLRQADTDNPRGYYEFERVKQLDKGDMAWLPEARGKVVKVISALLRHLPSDYHYRVIFMEREMAEVLASQRQMLLHRQAEDADTLDDAEMARLFTQHLDETRQWLAQQPNITTLYVQYHQLLQDRHPQVHRINQFLGAGLDTEQMLQVIDPALYRNRQR